MNHSPYNSSAQHNWQINAASFCHVTWHVAVLHCALARLAAGQRNSLEIDIIFIFAPRAIQFRHFLSDFLFNRNLWISATRRRKYEFGAHRIGLRWHACSRAEYTDVQVRGCLTVARTQRISNPNWLEGARKCRYVTWRDMWGFATLEPDTDLLNFDPPAGRNCGSWAAGWQRGGRRFFYCVSKLKNRYRCPSKSFP